MEIEIKVKVSHNDLFNAVCFILGTSREQIPAHANQVIADIFGTPIEIDFSKIDNEVQKIFHLNGFVALMSTLRVCMEEAKQIEEEKSKPKIISL